MRYIIDENTLWEPTGRVVFNGATSRGTRSYIEVEFKEFYRHKAGSKIVYGRPFHVDMMSADMRAFAEILANAEKMLAAKFTEKSIPTRPNDGEEYDVYWGGLPKKESLPSLHKELDQHFSGWYCKSECTDKRKKYVYYLNGEIICVAKREL